jgi:hypothetical protein
MVFQRNPMLFATISLNKAGNPAVNDDREHRIHNNESGGQNGASHFVSTVEGGGKHENGQLHVSKMRSRATKPPGLWLPCPMPEIEERPPGRLLPQRRRVLKKIR